MLLSENVLYVRTVEASCKQPAKMQRLTLRGGGHLQESNHKGSLLRRGPGTSALWKVIYCMQCLSYSIF